MCSRRFASGRIKIEIGVEREVKPPSTGQAPRWSRGGLNRSCAKIGDASLLGVVKLGALSDIMRGDAVRAQTKEHPSLG